MSTLFPGQSLLSGQSLQSDNRLCTLIMQSDGNVVLRDSASNPLWRTGTGGGQFDPRDFIMQTDGNLVLYDTSGQWHWASQTSGNPGAFLNVQDDGNLVVYRAGSASQTAGNALWASGTSVPVPPPLRLETVVHSGETLNVGDANLSFLSYDMLFGQDAGPGGRSASGTVPGSWSAVGPGGCGGNPVTVNANIDATWEGGSNSVGSWTWQDLQQAFATALGTVMQTVANPTSYENYSYTEYPAGDTVVCLDPQFLDWGHYIPPKIIITAYNNAPDNTAEQAKVTVTYSTEDQSGGDVCGTIKDLVDSMLPLVLDDPVAAVVGTAMTVFCDLIGG